MSVIPLQPRSYFRVNCVDHPKWGNVPYETGGPFDSTASFPRETEGGQEQMSRAEQAGGTITPQAEQAELHRVFGGCFKLLVYIKIYQHSCPEKAAKPFSLFTVAGPQESLFFSFPRQRRRSASGELVHASVHRTPSRTVAELRRGVSWNCPGNLSCRLFDHYPPDLNWTSSYFGVMNVMSLHESH